MLMVQTYWQIESSISALIVFHISYWIDIDLVIPDLGLVNPHLSILNSRLFNAGKLAILKLWGYGGYSWACVCKYIFVIMSLIRLLLYGVLEANWTSLTDAEWFCRDIVFLSTLPKLGLCVRAELCPITCGFLRAYLPTSTLLIMTNNLVFDDDAWEN